MALTSCCRRSNTIDESTKLDFRQKLIKKANCKNIFGNVLVFAGLGFGLLTVISAIAIGLLFGPLFTYVPIVVIVVVCVVAAGVGVLTLISLVAAAALKTQAWNDQKNVIRYFQNKLEVRFASHEDFPRVKEADEGNPFV